MTPTEQDKELREKIQDYAIDFHNSYRPNYPTTEIDSLVMRIEALIAAQTKAARLDEQMHTQADIDGNVEYWPNGETVMSQLARIAQLQADQEGEV